MSAVHEADDGTATHDESTRLLCIGAHLDREFPDDAIREFLTEPDRALPPSLGVNPQVVLRECLAARRCRRIQDAVLTVLMAVFALTGPLPALAQIVVALGWRRVGPDRRRLDRASRSVGGLRAAALVVGAVGLGILVLLGTVATAALAVLRGVFGGGTVDPYGQIPAYGTGGSSPLTGLTVVSLVWPVVLTLAMFVVLWFDRHAVWSAVTGRLRRDRFTTAGPAQRTGTDAMLWGVGGSEHARRLADVEAPHVNCVV